MLKISKIFSLLPANKEDVFLKIGGKTVSLPQARNSLFNLRPVPVKEAVSDALGIVTIKSGAHRLRFAKEVAEKSIFLNE